MKNIHLSLLYGLVLCGLLFFMPSALAQNAPAGQAPSGSVYSKIPQKKDYLPEAGKTLEELSSERPAEQFVSKKTDNMTVAMLFHKITGQVPDLDRWAMQSNAVQNAPEASRAAMVEKIRNQLQTRFSLMGYDEPIHVESYVTLSQYNPESEGFFIEEFKDDTFFTYVFDNEYYAVIPTDLMDYEWIKVPKAKLEEIGPHITPKNQLYMRLSLVPLSGDAKEKVALSNGRQNWLLAAKVMDIEFWSPQDQSLLWRSNEDFYRRKNELLNLYR